VDELQATQLDAVRQGVRARMSTSEAIQQLDITREALSSERDKNLLAKKQTEEYVAANTSLQEKLNQLRSQLLETSNQLEQSRVREANLQTKKQLQRKEMDFEAQKNQRLNTAVTTLKHRLANATVVAEQSQAQTRKLRVHVAAASRTVQSSYLNLDPYCFSANHAVDPYLGQSLYTNAYASLSPVAQKYYLDNLATNELLHSASSVEQEKIRQINLDLELASVVDRDVESIRRARDRQRLAILRSEAELGLSNTASDIVERTLLESKLEVDNALGRSGSSYLTNSDLGL
jgi:hypothetical protein